MNNSTEQTLVIVTAVIPEWQRVSTALYTIAVLSAIWSIGANVIIIACFFRNRRRKWASFTRQTFSMVVSDLLVGLTAIPILVYELSGGRTYGVVCFATFYLLFSVQCVTLYHVLGVCIFRNMNIKTFVGPIRRSGQLTYAICVILVSWSVPCLVILVPFVLWGHFTHGQMDCYIETIFETETIQATLIIAFSYFIPQCLTNVVYAITCCRLWLHTRKIIVPIQTDTNGTENYTGAPRRNNVNTATTMDSPRPSTNTLTTQKRVLVTLGILLLLFNVFTFPVPLTVFIQKSQPISRNIRFAVSTLFIVNSGLNPIIYATRIASLREEVNKTFREIRNTLRL